MTASDTGKDPDDDDKTQKVSNLKYAELVGFFHQQIARVEMTWFRVMYLHGAIVGVLIFFSQADDPYTTARAIVFAFYTVNMLIFLYAFREGYSGLAAVHADLLRFDKTDGAVDRWFRAHRYDNKNGVRVAILLISWALVLFLLTWTWTSAWM